MLPRTLREELHPLLLRRRPDEEEDEESDEEGSEDMTVENLTETNHRRTKM